MSEPRFEPLAHRRLPPAEMLARAREFHAEAERRRTTRHFSSEPVPRELVELAVRTAGTAPSGAHRQPWRFVAVCDPELKAPEHAPLREVLGRRYARALELFRVG